MAITYQTMLMNCDPALAIVKCFPDFFHTQIIPLTKHAARLHHHAIQPRYTTSLDGDGQLHVPEVLPIDTTSK